MVGEETKVGCKYEQIGIFLEYSRNLLIFVDSGMKTDILLIFFKNAERAIRKR